MKMFDDRFMNDYIDESDIDSLINSNPLDWIDSEITETFDRETLELLKNF
jgi:hypothetical protein